MNANQTINIKSFVSIVPIFTAMKYMATTSKQQKEILQGERRGPGHLEHPEAWRKGLETMKNPEKAVTIQKMLYHYQWFCSGGGFLAQKVEINTY